MISTLMEAMHAVNNYRTAIAIGLPLLGGALATASSVLMPRGRAKGLLTGMYMLLASLGGACLVFAAAAAVTGASPAAVGPLLMLGIVLTPVMGIFATASIRQYQHFEFRRRPASIYRRS